MVCTASKTGIAGHGYASLKVYVLLALVIITLVLLPVTALERLVRFFESVWAARKLNIRFVTQDSVWFQALPFIIRVDQVPRGVGIVEAVELVAVQIIHPLFKGPSGIEVAFGVFVLVERRVEERGLLVSDDEQSLTVSLPRPRGSTGGPCALVGISSVLDFVLANVVFEGVGGKRILVDPHTPPSGLQQVILAARGAFTDACHVSSTPPLAWIVGGALRSGCCGGAHARVCIAPARLVVARQSRQRDVSLTRGVVRAVFQFFRA